jgi:acetolactate synthase small subunit
MNQNNLSKIIRNFIGVNNVYDFNSLPKSTTENSLPGSLTLLKDAQALPEEKSSSAFKVPILELYQYEIKNHPKEKNLSKSVEYKSLSDSENEDKCSVYSFTDDDEEETNISSCDIITNGPEIKFNENIIHFYEYLQNLYKIAKLKNNQVLSDKATMAKILIPYDSILELIAEYERIFDYLIKFKEEEEKKISIKEINSNNYVNHIKKVNTNNNEKFICIGDIHGSIHTFIRLLFRFHKYGILDIKTMKILEPYNIVFLGDVIDRGFWGLEIACTLIILLINNPQKMHWNSGNHEDKKLNEIYGFKNELSNKYNWQETETLHTLLNKFFGYLSCAIIIHNTDLNKKYWLAHGGLPQKIGSDNIVEPDVPFNKFFYSFDTGSKTWKKSEDESSGYYLVDDESAFTIKWGDFPYQGSCTRASSLKCLSSKYFTSFMLKYGIHGIIRGHQDSISNSLVFKKEDDKVLFNQENRTQKIDNIYWNDRKDTKNDKRYFGPIARLQIDSSTKSDLIHPVVTLSTNTDMGRILTADSFGLLRFDILSNNIENFHEIILKSRNKIIDLNNPKDESFKEKYLKYKIKYIQLKNSLKL